MAKIVTLGEIMLRLSTSGNQRIENSSSFDACFGGGEANVAVSLARFGHDAYFTSKIPNNPIGKSVIKTLKSNNVHTDYLLMGGDRLGIYYLETGSSIRPSKVIYDRKGSSFALSDIEDFDFDSILKGASLFHFSGITPALSENCAKIVEKACKTAKKLGILVSCDLNYRSKLWSQEEARKVMIPLMKYVDICIGNEEDANNCLGFVPKGDVKSAKVDAEGYKEIFKQMVDQFGFKYVATTLRQSYSASHNGWKAMLYDGKSFYESKYYDIFPIVDRVGAGDSFSAGLIHGLLTFNDLQKTVEFATAASAIKHTIPGDFNLSTIEEIKALMDGDGSGRVVR